MAHDQLLVLPASVVTPGDLARLRREAEAVADQVHQAELRARSSGAKQLSGLPHIGNNLTQICELNKLDFQQPEHRDEVVRQLDNALKTAPTVTMSFAVDPSSDLMGKIVDWLRKNVHPQLVVRIGLQPSITAGCTLRTANQLYDFSLRKHFAEQRPLLVKRLKETAKEQV